MNDLCPIKPRGLQRQGQRFRDVPDLHRCTELPGDDVAREVVQYRAEVKPAPADDLEIGEVGLPKLVRRRQCASILTALSLPSAKWRRSFWISKRQASRYASNAEKGAPCSSRATKSTGYCCDRAPRTFQRPASSGRTMTLS